MIDDKKIEEAASAYGTSNGYSVIGPDGRISLKPELETAFEAGVHWAINEFLKGLWHPASKEPEKFRKILYTGGSIDTTDTTMLIINNSWNTKVCLLKIKKWCYIDDLFPKGGGNYD
mgnify:FL=1